jgi:protocatechuate 3,4-dioxygenase beta subunit
MARLFGSRLTRREALGAGGMAGAGLLLGCGSGGGTGASSPATSAAASATSTEARMPACVLAPEQEEGPFYVDLERVRDDIVDGRPGLPLRLRVHVVDARTCEPLRSAAVDVWHCDALGSYSDEPSEGTTGQTYLRGTQITDPAGVVEFRTIFPGHYQGRTTHIHVKVHVGGQVSGGRYTGGRVSHTGQFFTPDAINSEVYGHPPYARDTAPIVTHGEDMVYTQQQGSSGELTMRKLGRSAEGGYLAAITVGVDPGSAAVRD